MDQLKIATTVSPRIYEYLDPVHFLKDQLKQKKEENPSHSFRDWAHEMGLQNPELLVSWLNGKKQIRPRHFQLLKKILPLDDTEETYFQTLVARKSAKTEEEKEIFNRILNALSPGKRVPTIITAESEMFSNWAILALMLAMEIPDLRSESALINAFKDKLSATDVQDFIALLIKKKFVSLENGELKPIYQMVSSPTDQSITSIHNYYRQVLDLAKDAISVGVNEREFQFFSLTLDSNDVPAFKQIIRDFRTKLASRSIHTPRPDSVYQVAVEFFPIASSNVKK